ncbi:MAG: hypothetical protein LUD79_06420 [Oscillospiraceae bacterium]|nr:hypothetical protein [Oscillospiraceae bacterium]
MYNRYLDNAEFQPVEPAPNPSGQPGRTGGKQSGGILSDLLSRLTGSSGEGRKNAGGLSGIFHGFKLDELDRGDILLILILLYLFWESEDEELLIILGLLLLTGS